MIVDGQNEKARAIGMLYVPGYAQYQDPSVASADKSLGSWKVPLYLLSTCATVDEVVAVLKNVSLPQQIFPAIQGGAARSLVDRRRERQVRHFRICRWQVAHPRRPLFTLTKPPPYDWQEISVSNFINLSPVNAPSEKIGISKSSALVKAAALSDCRVTSRRLRALCALFCSRIRRRPRRRRRKP